MCEDQHENGAFVCAISFSSGIVTKITGAVIVISSAAFYINGTMSAVYAIGMTISAFMLYSSLECAGNYSSLLHVVSVCVDKANAILELDTMDIDGKEIKPQNCNIKLDHISFLMTREKSLMMYRFQFLKRQQQQLLVHLVAVNLHCAI